MSELVKATLQRIRSDESGQVETEGPAVDVQFNPASLRLALSNSVEGGQFRGRQARQFLGRSSTELSFDLVFDTADETSGGGQPRSVRERTALVEQFVIPEVRGEEKQAPPKVRFHWKDLIVDGVISNLTIDLDHFAADGTPLRAKMSVSIREQDVRYTFLRRGRGANRDDPPPAGAQGRGGPGTVGGGPGQPTDRTAPALAGESAADFARRQGLDPAAWRGLSAGLEDPLSLPAGLEIDFSSGLSAGPGLGATPGVREGVSASLEASLGLEGREAGFALTAAGGVGAAVQTVRSERAQAAVSATRRAFAAPAPTPSALPVSAPARPAPPQQPHPRLARTGLPPASRQAPPAPPPPRADPRATTFGHGVPLRPRVAVASLERSSTLSGHGALGPTSRTSTEAPRTWEGSASPWTRLPAGDRARAAAEAKRGPRGPRGCGGACGCGSRGGCSCR